MPHPKSAERPLIVVVGPTASGKTELAVRLAEILGGEIIGADSVQVYTRFDVGTGKPTQEQRARARHHVIDIIDPLDPIDAARWAALAESALDDIRGRGKRAIICGGTFLWIRALLFGLAEAPPGDETLRTEHRKMASEMGREALHARLAELDPATAAGLSPNDFVRVSRALEVLELTGVPLIEWQRQHGFRRRRYAARLVGVAHERGELNRRIADRVDRMLEAGWVREVRRLRAAGYGSARAMGSVGYRQIADALDRGTADDHDELRAQIDRKTRIFARRQRTWLRDQPVEWIGPDDAKAIE